VNYRFGVFEFESDSGELRKSGRSVALEPQPARALALLLARADQLVTREELKDTIWGKDTHVDFDRGLAYCISEIRTALGDAGDSPRFVQTIPKKGYRFIAPVHLPVPVIETPEAPAIEQTAPVRPTRYEWLSRPMVLALVAAVLLCAGVAAGIALRSWESSDRIVVAVSVFDNETGRIEYDRLVAGLSDVLVTRLTELAPDRIAVVGNAAVLRQPRNIRNLKAVAAGVQADYLLLGQLQQADAGLRFITHVIRLNDETHLKANRLSFPDGDLTELEPKVLAEFERAVHQHLLSSN
jgi:DNA-binding winged helix-turn-helix (wHTH) protein/TolB-like protein